MLTTEELNQLNAYNHVILNKKPYFFKHLYDDTKKTYNNYINESNMNCKNEFRINLNELKSLERKTIKQKKFIQNFKLYMPVVISDSPMNLMCNYIESINFDIKKHLKTDYDKNIFKQYMNKDFKYNKQIYDIVKNEFDNFIKIYRSKWIDGQKNNKIENDDIKESMPSSFFTDNLKNKLNSLCGNVYSATNYAIKYFYEYKPSSNKDILWIMYGKYIFNNVKHMNNNKCMFPFPDNKGDILYLGKKYKMKEVLL